MIHAILIREQGNQIQTLGELQVYSSVPTPIFECKTLELPDLNNQKGISCIPVGEYECEKVAATAAIPYPHFAILDVQNRSGICGHRANYWRQLRGCIAFGDKHVDIDGDGEKDVRNSSATFESLMAILPDKFKLTIQ